LSSLAFPGFEQESLWVPLRGKTKVVRWTFDPPVDPVHVQQMQMQARVAAAVTIDERGQHWGLSPLVETLIAEVETVLNRFAVFFR
jgi:hypothetical protein